ncbi:unnamed protein product [Arctia plantaginis]|uniref:Major facilitator superfamily (MFS) profile domain-containing protein n=1 Tax=Arctia plantaginis TaxID=874455 RepID=A0A8S1AIN0_ARCPL|nr:unnamed protein product [Arctia plantaginis]
MDGHKKMEADMNKQEKYAADLDHALEVAGIGWYNLKYSLVLSLLPIAFVLDQIGYSIVLPAAACDLHMSDKMRGIVASMPYVGIMLTSYPWGYLVDTKGRKKMVLYSCFTAGIFSALCGLMPGLKSFAVSKFISSLCLACPIAVPYTYISEILPPQYKDIMISLMNSLQLTGTVLVPLLAWAILPMKFSIDLGAFYFRPWRLLSLIYASSSLIAAILLTFGPESPKYLVTQDRYDEALKVLQNIYAGNKGRKPEEYPINKLIVPADNRTKGNFLTSLKEQTTPFTKWSYSKWIILNGFLLFGTYSVLNGLYIWSPDVLNRVMTGGGKSRTACEVITNRVNQTLKGETICKDNLDEVPLIVSSIAQAIFAVIVIIVSSTVKLIGKRNLLFICYFLIGAFCVLINFIRNDMVFATILSSLPVLVLTIGSVKGYIVELIPTHLRGMALTLAMMLGTIGSVAGNNIAGLLINHSCEIMFYLFGGLLILCGGLSVLLPASDCSSKICQDEVKEMYISKM